MSVEFATVLRALIYVRRDLFPYKTLIVASLTGLNNELIAKGLMRNVASNLQQLRKECSFNPTDVLKLAQVCVWRRKISLYLKS